MRIKTIAIAIAFMNVTGHAQTPVKGTITLTADAVDVGPGLVCGVANVQFFLDNATLSPLITATGTTFTYAWDTTTVPNGPYLLSAKATDKAGLNGLCDSTKPNVGTSGTQSVVVGNLISDTTPPIVTLTVPLIADNHFTPIKVAASDGSGIATMQLSLNNTIVSSWSGVSQATYNWNTRPYKGRTVTVKLEATDTTGLKTSETALVRVK